MDFDAKSFVDLSKSSKTNLKTLKQEIEALSLQQGEYAQYLIDSTLEKNAPVVNTTGDDIARLFQSRMIDFEIELSRQRQEIKQSQLENARLVEINQELVSQVSALNTKINESDRQLQHRVTHLAEVMAKDQKMSFLALGKIIEKLAQLEQDHIQQTIPPPPSTPPPTATSPHVDVVVTKNKESKPKISPKQAVKSSGYGQQRVKVKVKVPISPVKGEE
jgi:hypothetical protein